MNNTSLQSAQRKRPKLVWMITIFYVISAGWTLISFALIYSGVIEVTKAQEAYFKSQTFLDALITVAIGSLNVIGSISLFFLKRKAFYLFLSAFILSMLTIPYEIFFKQWLAAIGGPGLIGSIIGWVISFAIIIYARRLIKHDILN
jgi:hypothetical protein